MMRTNPLHLPRLLALALAFVLGLCAWIGTGAAQQRWATYANPRFGAAADYPADLFTVKDAPPENGDGQTFRTADGRGELSIYGSYNIDGERPEPYVQRHVSLSDVTYKKISADFYAVSGTRGGTIYYERCNFPNNDVLSCFYISYPAAEKAKWDPIVTRIGQSLHLALTGSQ
jgi:hypothetical protein